MIAHVLRFWGEYVSLVEFVRAGKLGAPISATAARLSQPPGWGDWFLDPAVSGGAVLDLCVHDFDMLNWLLGTPVSVYARGREQRPGLWNDVHALVDYGATNGCVDGSQMMPEGYPFMSALKVLCEGGVVELLFRAGGVSVEMGGGASLTVHADGRAYPLPPKPGDAYDNQAAYFVDCVRKGIQPTLGTPEQARLAVAVRMPPGGRWRAARWRACRQARGSRNQRRQLRAVSATTQPERPGAAHVQRERATAAGEPGAVEVGSPAVGDRDADPRPSRSTSRRTGRAGAASSSAQPSSRVAPGNAVARSTWPRNGPGGDARRRRGSSRRRSATSAGPPSSRGAHDAPGSGRSPNSASNRAAAASGRNVSAGTPSANTVACGSSPTWKYTIPTVLSRRMPAAPTSATAGTSTPRSSSACCGETSRSAVGSFAPSNGNSAPAAIRTGRASGCTRVSQRGVRPSAAGAARPASAPRRPAAAPRRARALRGRDASAGEEARHLETRRRLPPAAPPRRRRVPSGCARKPSPA